ncbi:unknown [Prevotella sp. CAG:487]|nr:unknown [Prevotella sp. CAG:487]
MTTENIFTFDISIIPNVQDYIRTNTAEAV